MWHRKAEFAPSWSTGWAYAFPTAILTTGCSVGRPRPGDASGQGYRDNPVIHTLGPPDRRRRRFPLRDVLQLSSEPRAERQ